MAHVSIPLLLSDVAGGVRETQVPGATLREVVASLETAYPGIAGRIHHEGKISPNLALVVDGRIAAQGLDTPIRPDARVDILPAFGGG